VTAGSPPPGSRALKAAAWLSIASTAAPFALLVVLIESAVRRARWPLDDLLFMAGVAVPPLAIVGGAIVLLRWPATAPAWPLAVALALGVVPSLMLMVLSTFGPADLTVLLGPCAIGASAVALVCVAVGAWTRARAR
jgi:hypothetical protein